MVFFFNDPATTEIYTLSLHDALPISGDRRGAGRGRGGAPDRRVVGTGLLRDRDRKSTRLNSSHQIISYAVFGLKKKSDNRGRARGCARSAGHRQDLPADRARIAMPGG